MWYGNHWKWIHGHKEPSFAMYILYIWWYIGIIARAVKTNDGKRAWNVSNWMWPSNAVK